MGLHLQKLAWKVFSAGILLRFHAREGTSGLYRAPGGCECLWLKGWCSLAKICRLLCICVGQSAVLVFESALLHPKPVLTSCALRLLESIPY